MLEIINKQPHLIHRMDGQFGVRPNVCPMLYTEYDENWLNSSYYSIHLLIRGNELSSIGWCLDDKKPPVYVFNETIVWTLNTTFGDMSREVLQYEQNLLKIKNIT